MKHLLSTYNDESFLDNAFGSLPDIDEELDEIEEEIEIEQMGSKQHKVCISYSDFKKKKNAPTKLDILIQGRWRSFYLSQIELDKQHKTVIISIALCRQKNIHYKPKEVIQ